MARRLRYGMTYTRRNGISEDLEMLSVVRSPERLLTSESWPYGIYLITKGEDEWIRSTR